VKSHVLITSGGASALGCVSFLFIEDVMMRWKRAQEASDLYLGCAVDEETPFGFLEVLEGGVVDAVGGWGGGCEGW